MLMELVAIALYILKHDLCQTGIIHSEKVLNLPQIKITYNISI